MAGFLSFKRRPAHQIIGFVDNGWRLETRFTLVVGRWTLMLVKGSPVQHSEGQK